ncbi:MAG: hypothetical protein F9B45_28975 [Phycisphaera sp. RhM]|nr:hypothetical protein [Phycisphaera sp. RhM]
MNQEQQTDVAGFLRALHPDGVFEIRAFDCPDSKGSRWTKTVSGYFDDHDKAAECVRAIELCEPPGIYVTVNPVEGTSLALANNRLIWGAKKTTGDPNIERRRFLFIDIDPKRLSGISSTADELNAAHLIADELEHDLSGKGWPAPITGMSGNGCYLLYRIDLPNNDESDKLIGSVLKSAASCYGNKKVSVDTTASNASRLMKLLGTMARKGSDFQPEDKPNREHRPHRRSWHANARTDLGIVTEDQLRAFVEEVGVEESEPEPAKRPGMKLTAGDFSLERWISDHGVPVGDKRPWQGGSKWVFAKDKTGSPLCSDHGSDGAAFIVQGADGKIGAGCHHDHCTWKWPDLRTHYEPDAYSKRSDDDDGPEVNLDGIEKQAKTQAQQQAPGQTDDAGGQDKSKDKAPPTVDAVSILRELVADLKAGKGDNLYKFGAALDGLEIGSGLLAGLAAGPGVGKTALSGQCIFEALEHNPELNVYCANAETGFKGLLKREFSARTSVPTKALRFADLTPAQIHEIERAAQEIERIATGGRLHVLPIEQCNPMGLAGLLHQCEPGFLVVDYLQKFVDRGKDARLAVNDLMGFLRVMASKGWGILCLSATSRTSGKGGSAHNGDDLTLASFKESGEIEFNLDAAYLLRDRGEVTPGVRGVRNVVLDCVKNRHGEQTKTALVFHMPRMRFEAPCQPEPDLSGLETQHHDPYDNPFNEPVT